MPNNIIMRAVDVTGTAQLLSATSLIGSFTISTPPTNGANVEFTAAGENGSVEWVPGEWHELKGIDLATISVKGTPGDIVTIIGGTW